MGALVILVLGFAILPCWAGNDTDKLIGDISQILLPAAGLGLTYYYKDSEGRTQWVKSIGSTIVATEVLKYSLNGTYLGRRPNGGERGFPSGHTALACSGSFFMGSRYGWAYGIPGLLLAAQTGYSRVDEGLHHWRDVIAGCGVAFAINGYFVDRWKNETLVTPEVGSHYIGLRLSHTF